MSTIPSLSPDIFLSEVNANNTNADGSLKDPSLLRRMQNPICQKCHLTYRAKYPGQTFKVKCQGIYDDTDYAEKKQEFESQNPGETITLEEVREVYDTTFWSEKYLRVKNEAGDFVPFHPRWYQDEALRCTAMHTVDRWGRGTGKTINAIAKELHRCYTRKNYPVLVICPAQSQSQKWYDEIKLQLDHSPELYDSLKGKRKQPYHEFTFNNGSTLAIFTAGSKSGRGADSVRGQDPRRVRLDEQDYLVDKDYQAIMPLARRHKNSEFAGSSTPTGLRSMYWEMCTRMPEYREFYVPITFHPDWDEHMREACIKEAKTLDRYRHEFMAEFGDPAQGVFKGVFIDQAKKNYHYNTLTYDSACHYAMGIDWNGKGTGTRIRVVQYDPKTKIRRSVDWATIDSPSSTMRQSMDEIVRLNRKWHCDDVYIDFGFGAAQDEMIRAIGETSTQVDDRRLRDVRVIDFGANLKFNRLTPKRDDKRIKYTEDEDDELERRTKPFMVDGVVMGFEQSLIEISFTDDNLLEEQLRTYRVKTWSQHGYANTYESGDSGDHDLDAFMLGLLAIEMRYGLFHTQESVRRLAQISRVPGWGLPTYTPDPRQIVTDRMEERRNRAGVPSRTSSGRQDAARVVQSGVRGGAWVIPNRAAQSSPITRGPGGVISRTAVFRNKTPYGSPRRLF